MSKPPFFDSDAYHRDLRRISAERHAATFHFPIVQGPQLSAADLRRPHLDLAHIPHRFAAECPDEETQKDLDRMKNEQSPAQWAETQERFRRMREALRAQ